jgi:transcription termination/antitermination protein NusG
MSGAPFGCESGVSNMSYDGEVYDPDSRWYAVWTRSRQEKVSAAMLSALGIQHYLPLNSELRQWSDRKQLVEVPLFSGYLFVCISLLKNSKLQVLKIPGIGAFVGNQTGPLPIPDQQIEDIRTVLTAGVECSIHPFLKEGDRVRVVRGTLAGVEGTLVHTNSTSRLLISIEMIRQSLSVNVLRDDVELVRPNLAMYFGHPAPLLGVQS